MQLVSKLDAIQKRASGRSMIDGDLIEANLNEAGLRALTRAATPAMGCFEGSFVYLFGLTTATLFTPLQAR